MKKFTWINFAVFIISAFLAHFLNNLYKDYNPSRDVSFEIPQTIQTANHARKRTVSFPSNWEGDIFLSYVEAEPTFQVGEVLTVDVSRISEELRRGGIQSTNASSSSQDASKETRSYMVFGMDKPIPVGATSAELKILQQRKVQPMRHNREVFELEEDYYCEVLRFH